MGLFGAIGAALGGSKGRNSLSDFMKQITPKNNTAVGKPVDNSHSHSNDSSTQQRSGGRPETQQPVPIVQPNNMANNNYTNPNTQRVGADLFKGEALASQTAQRRMTGSNPTPLPGEESGGMGDNQLEAPLMQTNFPHSDPNKDRPYVVNERPGVWQPGTEDRSRDTLFLPKSFKGQKGKMIDEGDYIDNSKINKDEYFQVGVQDLEDQGRIKIRK